MKGYSKYFIISLVIILIDQAIKLAVDKYMIPGIAGQKSIIGDFFKLHYVLNPGFAFGITLNFPLGKLLLTLFRIFAIGFIAYFIVDQYKAKAHGGFLACLGLILGGAAGNVIDCIFYGKYLNNAPFLDSEELSHSAANAWVYEHIHPWFHGQVVDMFFFDIWEGPIPSWIPIIGGTYYSTPIFNFADASIFVGVVLILIFKNSFLIADQSKLTLESVSAPTDQSNANSSESSN
jgi:signal peptidase II